MSENRKSDPFVVAGVFAIVGMGAIAAGQWSPIVYQSGDVATVAGAILIGLSVVALARAVIRELL